MNGRELVIGMSFVHSKYVQEAEGERPRSQKQSAFFRKKSLLIAAIITTAAILMGAAIDALISMHVEDIQVNTPTKETQVDEMGNTEQIWIDNWHDGEKVNFNEVQDVFIELGSYYPQTIPSGYEMVFISDALYQQQTIEYENASGMGISYTIYIPSEASDIEVYDIVDRSDVKVNGQDGILYEQTNGYRTLVWIDSEQGFGFRLRTGDPNIDLIAMAESTAEGERLTHSREDETAEARAELGDFSPEYLPEGFEEQGVLGSPLSEGGGWYSYVRKWYVNKAENTRIYFEYESYVIATEEEFADDARTVCSFWIPGYNIQKGIVVGEEVEINGMFGIATESHIAWADPETHRVFHLTSKDIIGAELLKVAQSISENP